MIKQTLYVITIVVILFIIFSIAACTKDTVLSAASQPVVIGYLIPGQPVSVKVYQQKGLTDTANYGALITGLQLQVSDGSTTLQLTESATGTYTHADSNFLIAGKTYTLKFTYEGAEVLASTVMPARPQNYTASKTLINVPARTGGNPITGNTDSVAVKFKWSNPDSLYHVLVFKNDDNSPGSVDLNFNRPVNFTVNPKQESSYDLHYRSINYLGIYRVILYRVNKEYSALLTSNTNSNSQQLSNPPSNVINGFGVFTAMQADTIAIKVTQY